METSEVLILAARGSGNRTKIDLRGSFDQFWNAITTGTGIGPILSLLSIVGVALIAFALVKWAWDRRRGGGGGGQSSGAVWGALLVGALLSLPEILLPIFLTFLDVVVNGALKVWASANSGG